MAVSDYLQKSSGTCRYSYSKLKDVLYLVSYEHLKDVQIDNGEAYISGLTELPLRINGFNIQFNEETSLDERYKFQKTLTLSMHGYVNYKIFGGRYYAIIEDVEGTFYMINVDFPSRITHTFNLAKDTNQTDFTFSSLSNFPTLKLNAEFEAVSPVCLGLNVYGIEKLQLIEKEKARLDTVNKTVISTEDFKTIEFLGNSCSFQEVYDGFKVTDTIQFNIALDNYKPSWQYNLLEFLDNRYSAIITPRGNDNKYYPGYNFGLQPSYTIQTASNPSESDIISITLVETSSQGSTAAVDWKDEQSTETRWRWVKRVGDTICYECIGLGRARYLVRQEVDLFGNPTGNYQVMEGYESQYPNFHVVATFTTQEIFETSECSEDETCQIDTTIPTTIYFNAVTCNTYTLQTSCDWEIVDIPSNITVSPSSGNANTNYTVSICNTATPSTTPIENTARLRCCSVNRPINLKVIEDNNCIRPSNAYINCLGQEVSFVYDGSCRPTITSIDSRLTYEIGTNRLTVKVPRNYNTSAITWTIAATNCGCSSSSTTFAIHQDKTYERWVEGDGFVCESGNSYHIERRYTGVTQDNLVRTNETRKGSLISSGDTRCGSSQTKWEWDNESYYCVNGNKVKAIFEWISYDNGTNWLKTGNTRLGDIVESASTWCASAVTYSWVLTDKYECEGMPSGTKIYATYSDDKTYSLPCNDSTELTQGETRPVGYEASAMTSAVMGCVTNIGAIAFSGCSSLTSVTIPSSVTSIYWSAFENCSGLTSITIPSSVRYIDQGVFENCSNLTDITIPNSVTYIGIMAFNGCSSLTSVTIPNSVTSILWGTFENCSSLASVNIPSGVTIIDGEAFLNTPWYNSYKSDTSHHYGNTVYINDVAYEAVDKNITTCDFKNTTTCIAGDAFDYCNSLTSVTIPNSVTYIGDYAFYHCDSLRDVTIGSGVTRIGMGVFDSCTGLTSVTVNATTPPRLGSNVFYGSNCPIYVPAQSVDAYKTASGWSTYASRITAIS